MQFNVYFRYQTHSLGPFPAEAASPSAMREQSRQLRREWRIPSEYDLIITQSGNPGTELVMIDSQPPALRACSA